jgi:small subunit ribosomal protein S2
LPHSLRCIQVIAGVLGRAGEAGQKKRFEAAARGEITFRPAQGLEMPGEEGQEAARGKKPIVNEAEINKIIEFARKQDEADAAEERERAIRGENID